MLGDEAGPELYSTRSSQLRRSPRGAPASDRAVLQAPPPQPYTHSGLWHVDGFTSLRRSGISTRSWTA